MLPPCWLAQTQDTCYGRYDWNYVCIVCTLHLPIVLCNHMTVCCTICMIRNDLVVRYVLDQQGSHKICQNRAQHNTARLGYNDLISTKYSIYTSTLNSVDTPLTYAYQFRSIKINILICVKCNEGVPTVWRRSNAQYVWQPLVGGGVKCVMYVRVVQCTVHTYICICT